MTAARFYLTTIANRQTHHKEHFTYKRKMFHSLIPFTRSSYLKIRFLACHFVQTKNWQVFDLSFLFYLISFILSWKHHTSDLMFVVVVVASPLSDHPVTDGLFKIRCIMKIITFYLFLVVAIWIWRDFGKFALPSLSLFSFQFRLFSKNRIVYCAQSAAQLTNSFYWREKH